MQGLVEEILISPIPLIVLVGDAGDYLTTLQVSLKAAGLPRSGIQASVQLRYEHCPFEHRFAPRQRIHSEQEYRSYIPAGILASNWLSKHQNFIPSVVVRPSFPPFHRGFFSPFSLWRALSLTTPLTRCRARTPAPRSPIPPSL